jgi:CheY-like chemotaxis protein/HPt (histidine-containing phosphotransfer) domain-containing protein
MRRGLAANRPPLRILLVDDDPQSQRFAARVLKAAGAHIDLASSGEAAVAAASRHAYDLILMDLHMPGIDGADAAVAIRAAERDAGQGPTPIVALTGHVDRALRDRCRNAGVNDFVVKPLSTRALSDAVAKWAGGRATFDEPPPAEHETQPGAIVTSAVNVPDAPARADITPDVDPLVVDLVPGYVHERRRQLVESRHLIDRREFRAVERMAHDFKGTGSAYGIPDVSRLARDLEIACRRTDATRAVGVIEELDAVLARVQQRVGERP